MERPVSKFAQRERERRDLHYSYTIIMHIYNEENHLRPVFNALERQTVKPLDIIVVDDGSTDNTKDILHEYGYNHVHLDQPVDLYKPVRRSNAFNKAVELAHQYTPTAEYLMKVDGDTLVYDSYAEHTIKYMVENPRCAAVSGVSVRYIKTRDLNNGAVTYRASTLPKAKPIYGWDRDIQLNLVSKGHTFHVIRTLGYGEMRRPTVSGSPGVKRVVQNRLKSRIAEICGLWHMIKEQIN